MRENFDPNTLEDEGVRQLFITLMNMVENLMAKVQAQAKPKKSNVSETRTLGSKGNKAHPISSRRLLHQRSQRKKNAVSPKPITKPRSMLRIKMR
jgi:hypothetical protein